MKIISKFFKIILLLSFFGVGQLCYLEASDFENSEVKIIIKNRGVNIRAGAGLQFQVIAKATVGDSFKYLDKIGEWYKIELPEMIGYTIKSYLAKANLTFEAYVKPEALNIRKQPDTQSSFLTKLFRSDKVKILKEDSEFAKVKIDKRIAYIHSSLCIKSDENKANITASRVNIRSGPGTDFPVIAKGYKGMIVYILEKENDWYFIKIPAANTGYIYSKFIRIKPKKKKIKPSTPVLIEQEYEPDFE